jgi:peptide/nickel transport system substrate-binding protein
MTLWQQAHRILHEDQPYTFLINRKALSFYDKRIKNIKPSKLGLNLVQFYAMPIPWYVPTAEQKYKE